VTGGSGNKPTTPLTNLGVQTWPVADRPGFLNDMKRLQWAEKLGTVDQRPQDARFTSDEQYKVEQLAAEALDTPPGDVLFDPVNGGTILIGGRRRDGRRAAVVVSAGLTGVRAMRLHPLRSHRKTIDLPDNPDAAKAAIRQLAMGDD
jgi:hypothetical protein